MRMEQKRTGIVSFDGQPVTLVGPDVGVGAKAPEFRVVDGALEPVTLADSAGKVRLISVVPSVDTPICQAQTRYFNEDAADLPENVVILTLSVDLPFAQKRWIAAEGIDRVQLLSDYQERSFGCNYGLLIDEVKLLARAVLVVDANDIIVYREIVDDLMHHPNYDAAIEAAGKAAAGR